MCSGCVVFFHYGCFACLKSVAVVITSLKLAFCFDLQLSSESFGIADRAVCHFDLQI